jgi:hypothetical protein
MDSRQGYGYSNSDSVALWVRAIESGPPGYLVPFTGNKQSGACFTVGLLQLKLRTAVRRKGLQDHGYIDKEKQFVKL